MRSGAPEWVPHPKLNRDAAAFLPNSESARFQTSPVSLRSAATSFQPRSLTSSSDSALSQPSVGALHNIAALFQPMTPTGDNALPASSLGLRSSAPSWEPPPRKTPTLNKDAVAWQPSSVGSAEFVDTEAAYPSYDTTDWSTPAEADESSFWAPTTEVFAADATGAWIAEGVPGREVGICASDAGSYDASGTWIPLASLSNSTTTGVSTSTCLVPEYQARAELQDTDMFETGRDTRRGEWLPDDVCWNFKKTGLCSRGNQCHWLHGAETVREAELRVQSAAKPFAADEQDDSCAIFVSGLAPETTSDDLRAYFSEMEDDVKEALVFKDWQSGQSKGIGRVDFTHEEGMIMAIQVLHGTELDGSTISVSKFVNGGRWSDTSTGRSTADDQSSVKPSSLNATGKIIQAGGTLQMDRVLTQKPRPDLPAPHPPRLAEQRPPPGFLPLQRSTSPEHPSPLKTLVLPEDATTPPRPSGAAESVAAQSPISAQKIRAQARLHKEGASTDRVKVEAELKDCDEPGIHQQQSNGEATPKAVSEHEVRPAGEVDQNLEDFPSLAKRNGPTPSPKSSPKSRPKTSACLEKAAAAPEALKACPEEPKDLKKPGLPKASWSDIAKRSTGTRLTKLRLEAKPIK